MTVFSINFKEKKRKTWYTIQGGRVEGRGKTRYAGMKGGRGLKKHGKQGHLCTTSGMD